MWKTKLRVSTRFVFTFVALVSCTETTTTSNGIFGEDVSPPKSSSNSWFANSNGSEANTQSASFEVLGNDRFVNSSRSNPSASERAIIVPRDNSMVEVSLVNASVAAAADAILSDTLGLRYAIADGVKGTVTIQSTRPIPKDALLDLFEAALAANGALIRSRKGVATIEPGNSGSRTFRMASEGIGSGANIIVARLDFISATQMVDLLRPLTAEGLSVMADRRRNLILLSGSAAQQEAALAAINLYDVDVLKGKSVTLIELNNADPEAIAEELKLIFENEENGSLDGIIQFEANKRLGSILVITSRSRYLSSARDWIRKLDRKAGGSDRLLEVYELQNRGAADVAPILNRLLSEGIVSDETVVSAEHKGAGSRVAADDTKNALLVRATRKEHRQIQALLRDLDSLPQQVLIEATIAEVRLNDSLDLGVRWFFENGNFDYRFSDADTGGTGPIFPGFSVVFGTGNANVALNALASVTDIKIISSPTLMVLDNQEAVLQIGDQVPVATQSSTETTSGDAPTITNIEYRDTGVILTVTPSISRNGKVVLDVVQEISSVSEEQTSGIDSPTIRQRKVATNVMLSDGSTLALGGLVQSSNTKTVTKVPALGDVPVLGNLFRRTESGKIRSELLILIRPRVVDTDQQARSTTEYWRTKLPGANSLLRSGLGSPRHTIREVLK